MTRRVPLIVGNWKMNLTETWGSALVRDLLAAGLPARGVEIAVAPAFPCLRVVADAIGDAPLILAAQNLHWEEKGAYTGEVSGRMLAEAGVRMVIVGHSERRTLFGDTDERVGKKAAAARRHELVPIVCVGEQEKERDEGRTLEVVERQLRRGLADVRVRTGEEIVVAYEPVWAIGTGRVATPDQVDEVHRALRERLASMYGAATAGAVRILYGGSVSPDNAAELLALGEVDGALVGGASLDAGKFSAIAAAA